MTDQFQAVPPKHIDIAKIIYSENPITENDSGETWTVDFFDLPENYPATWEALMGMAQNIEGVYSYEIEVTVTAQEITQTPPNSVERIDAMNKLRAILSQEHLYREKASVKSALLVEALTIPAPEPNRKTSTLNLTDEELAKMEELALSALPKWAQEEIRRYRSHEQGLSEALLRRLSELEDECKEQSIFTVEQVMAGTPMDMWRAHAGVHDMTTFKQWLFRTAKEMTVIGAREVLDRNDPSDELYPWLRAKAAAIHDVYVNFKKAESGTHSDDQHVDAFAHKMKAKLAQKRDEGRGGWDNHDECTAEDLSRMLLEHAAKGDPVDVANFCMMLGQRGDRIISFFPEVRHIKRGSTYQVITREGRLQTEVPLEDNATLVFYMDGDGHFAARPPAEFDDGRFEPVDA